MVDPSHNNTFDARGLILRYYSLVILTFIHLPGLDVVLLGEEAVGLLADVDPTRLTS